MPETRAALTRRRAESNNARAAEPVAAALALLSPRGLGRLSCSSRLWRDAAAKVGAPLHVYAISSHSSDITPGIYGGEGEHYGISYLGREPPPFDLCRGLSGGVLELSLIRRSYARDDGAREWPEDVDSDVEQHVSFEAVTVICSGPAVSESVDPVIRALNASGILEQDIAENGKIRFNAIDAGVLKFAPNRLARLPRACDFLPVPLLRQVAEKIVAASDAPERAGTATMGVDWASSLLGVAPPQDWGPPLALSDVRDRLRITKFVWEAPRQPYYDFTFMWNVVLRDFEFMGDLEHKGLVDRVLGPHVSTRPPSAGEKQEFAEFMNTLADHERALNFRCMFGRTLDRDQLSALQAEAKFTVPLLDGMEVLQLNIWREMMRREK